MGIFKASFTIVIPVIALSQAAVAQQRGVPPQGVREVTVGGIPGVVAAGAMWTRAWQGTDNADGLVGSDDGGLLFAQEQPSRVSKLDVNDRVSVFLRDTHGAGALTIAPDGRLLAVERTCTDPGRNAAAGPCSEPTVVGVLAPERKTIADSFEGRPLGRLNDLVADKKGGAYFTVGGAFYASADGRVTSLGDNIRANGIILSRDDRIVYVTNGGTILAFDVQPDGTTTNRRDFARLEAGGAGDGMTIDAAGRVHVTSGPGVQVFDVEGKDPWPDPHAAKRDQRRILGSRQEDALCGGQRSAGSRRQGIRHAGRRAEQREDDLQDSDDRGGLQGARQVGPRCP